MATHYNTIEKFMARGLSCLPFVKKMTKSFYARLMFLFKRKKYAFCAKYDIASFGPNGMESFFGYYDKSPISRDGYVVCHLSGYSTRQKPDAKAPVTVTVFAPGETEKPLLRIPACAYNWQQGARAHWLTDELFIFNDFDNVHSKYISCVFSIKNLQEVKQFDYPVQDSFGTDYFLSINYRRLIALRPDYGYRNLLPLSQKELTDTKNDGIWKTDYTSGESCLLYSLANICDVQNKAVFNKAIHKVNHLMISPSGKQFIFIHRFYTGQRRFDRLLLSDAQGNMLKVLADYGMVSHCFWADEKTILAYLRGQNGKDAYYLIDTIAGSFIHFADGALDMYGDGHPHVNGEWFITDTYPDKARMQHLLLCNRKTGKLEELGEFFHGFDYSGETRCDLHPRFSLDGKKVFFDSVFDGTRKLYVTELKS